MRPIIGVDYRTSKETNVPAGEIRRRGMTAIDGRSGAAGWGVARQLVDGPIRDAARLVDGRQERRRGGIVLIVQRSYEKKAKLLEILVQIHKDAKLTSGIIISQQLTCKFA